MNIRTWATILPLTLMLMTMESCKSKQELTPKVRLETTCGDIVLQLYAETPQHRDNFMKLVDDGFYDGVLFHRVIADFMIQAGDPQSRDARPGQSLGHGDVGYTVPAEFVYPRYYHKRGAVAAARQGDQVNPQKASSGCQFYIVEGRTFSDADAISFGSWMGKTSWVIDESRDRKSYEVYQQKTADQAARFITVLLPYDGTSAKTVDAAFTKAYDANGAAVEVTVDETSYQLSYTLN